MALSSIEHVALTGLAACVPKQKANNSDCNLFTAEERLKLIKTTGIESRRISTPEQCTSDLCFAAAEKLLESSGTAKSDIDALVFVTQYTDYPLPATSAILQDRLKLPKGCLTVDIVLGCSGYVYGLSVIASLISAMKLRKGLLLVGDTISKATSAQDRSTYPLFGDAGTATLLGYRESAPPMHFDLGTDGSGHKTIIIPHGGLGSRNPAGKESFDYEQVEGGISRNKCHLILDGVEVFNFSLREPVDSARRIMDQFQLKVEDFDAFFFHQANRAMNELIRKKLKIPEERHHYSLREFGNTSCASIPLTMVTKYREHLAGGDNHMLLSGFGVGLSWGTCLLHTQPITCPELLEI